MTELDQLTKDYNQLKVQYEDLLESFRNLQLSSSEQATSLYNLYLDSAQGKHFADGEAAAIQIIAEWLADQPSSYEDAIADTDWKERLTKVVSDYHDNHSR